MDDLLRPARGRLIGLAVVGVVWLLVRWKMDLLTFILLLLVAAIAAGAYVLITGWNSRHFAAAFVFAALILVLPTLLPRLLGG